MKSWFLGFAIGDLITIYMSLMFGNVDKAIVFALAGILCVMLSNSVPK